jgi:hypothetical protein
MARAAESCEDLRPVRVVTADGRELTFLSRHRSASDILLIGPCALLGQKVRVLLPDPDGAPRGLVVRILWTCPVGAELVENGGAFLAEAGWP